MSLNPDVTSITLRQSITRKKTAFQIVTLFLLYFCIVLFTFLGTMWGFPMLILTLGTLFFAWYYKGVISITYEYQIDGHDFRILRLSGTRQRPVNVEFCHLNLQDMITVVDQGTDPFFEMEKRFDILPKHKRVTYYTSAHNPDRPGVVMYANGIETEAGKLVRVYLQPSGQLLHTLKLLCPGKVIANGE